MVEICGFLRGLISELKHRSLSSPVNSCGSLKNHMLSPLVATVVKGFVNHECISSLNEAILTHRVPAVVSRLLGGEKSTKEGALKTKVLEIFGAINLLGGTRTSPRKIGILGGTPSPLHLKGAIKSVIVRPLLHLVLIKLQV
jgi:hypothetical protein